MSRHRSRDIEVRPRFARRERQHERKREDAETTRIERPRVLPSQERERRIEQQIDELVTVARTLSPELKDAVAGSARETLSGGAGYMTRAGARAELPNAMNALERERTTDNVEVALMLATMARTPTFMDLIKALSRMEANEREELMRAGRSRARRYQSQSSRYVLFRDLVAASVDVVLTASPAAHREAVVLAQALAIKDARDLGRRTPPEHWRVVADDVAARLAKVSTR